MRLVSFSRAAFVPVLLLLALAAFQACSESSTPDSSPAADDDGWDGKKVSADEFDVDIDAIDLNDSHYCLDKDHTLFEEAGERIILACADWCDRIHDNPHESSNLPKHSKAITVFAWCDPVSDYPCECVYDPEDATEIKRPCNWEDERYCADDDVVMACSERLGGHLINCRDYCLAFFGPEFEPCYCRNHDFHNLCKCHDGGDCPEPIDGDIDPDNPYVPEDGDSEMGEMGEMGGDEDADNLYCSSDTDCRLHAYCSAQGICILGCQSHESCPQDQSCSEHGRCVPSE